MGWHTDKINQSNGPNITGLVSWSHGTKTKSKERSLISLQSRLKAFCLFVVFF